MSRIGTCAVHLHTSWLTHLGRMQKSRRHTACEKEHHTLVPHLSLVPMSHLSPAHATTATAAALLAPASHLNRFLVQKLANSKTFQRAAVRTHETLEGAKDLASDRSGTFASGMADARNRLKAFGDEVKRELEQETKKASRR